VNNGNLREQLEESEGKATDELDDDADSEDEADDVEPPFKVETRVKTLPTPRP
jgi:hypothetical protein